eukprot:4437704-Amphidinium_carterae.1
MTTPDKKAFIEELELMITIDSPLQDRGNTAVHKRISGTYAIHANHRGEDCDQYHQSLTKQLSNENCSQKKQKVTSRCLGFWRKRGVCGFTKLEQEGEKRICSIQTVTAVLPIHMGAEVGPIPSRM